MKNATKYLLYQIVGWILVLFILLDLIEALGLPAWAATCIFIAWVANDLAVYRLMRARYESYLRNSTKEGTTNDKANGPA